MSAPTPAVCELPAAAPAPAPEAAAAPYTDKSEAEDPQSSFVGTDAPPPSVARTMPPPPGHTRLPAAAPAPPPEAVAAAAAAPVAAAAPSTTKEQTATSSCTSPSPSPAAAAPARQAQPLTIMPDVHGRYGCPHCDANFTSEYGAVRHAKNNCPAKFPHKQKKKVLQKEDVVGISYLPNEKGRYECPHCDNLDFASEYSMLRHVEKSCPTLFPEKVKVKIKKQSIYRENTSIHTIMKKKNPPKKESVYKANAYGRFDCPHCVADFTSEWGVLRHVQNNCPTIFPERQKVVLKKERLYFPNAYGRYICPHCRLDLCSEYSMVRHVQKSCK
eukprot:gene8323-23773_t